MSDTKINLPEEGAENTENFYHDPFLGRTISLGIKKPGSKNLKNNSESYTSSKKTPKSQSKAGSLNFDSSKMDTDSQFVEDYDHQNADLKRQSGIKKISKPNPKNTQKANFGTDFVEAINVTSYGVDIDNNLEKNNFEDDYLGYQYKKPLDDQDLSMEHDTNKTYTDKKDFDYTSPNYEYTDTNKNQSDAQYKNKQSKKGSFLKDEESVSKIPTGAAFFEENDFAQESASAKNNSINNNGLNNNGLNEDLERAQENSFAQAKNLSKIKESQNLKTTTSSAFESKSDSRADDFVSSSNSLSNNFDTESGFVDKDGKQNSNVVSNTPSNITDSGYESNKNSQIFNVDHFDRSYQEKVNKKNSGIKTESFGIEIDGQMVQDSRQNKKYENSYVDNQSSYSEDRFGYTSDQRLIQKNIDPSQNQESGGNYQNLDYQNKFVPKSYNLRGGENDGTESVAESQQKSTQNNSQTEIQNSNLGHQKNSESLENQTENQTSNPKFVMVDPTEGLKDAQKRFEDALNKQKAYSSEAGNNQKTQEEDFDFESNKQKINKKAVFGKLFTGNSLGLIAFGSLLSAIIFYFGFLQPLIITDITQKTNQKISENNQSIQIQASKYLEFQNSLLSNFNFDRSASCGGSKYTQSSQDASRLNELLDQDLVLKYEEIDFKPLTNYKIEEEYNDLYDSYNRLLNNYREKAESLKDVINYLSFRNQIVDFCKNIEKQDNLANVKLECDTLKPLIDQAVFNSEEMIPVAPLIRELSQKCSGNDKTEILDASLKLIEFSPDYSNQKERLKTASDNLRMESRSTANQITKIYNEKTSWPGIIYLLDW